MQDQTERMIGHLAMIQAVIARMASNSFALKTLTVTLCAGVIALVGAVKNPSVLYILAAAGPVVVFSWMDANYLRLERLYRALYDDVRKGGELEPFDMRVTKYDVSVPSVFSLMLSWSVSALYATLLVVLMLVAIGVWKG